MKYNTILIVFLLILLVTGCVIEFIPQIEEERRLLVVEGLITDEYRTNKIKLSYSVPAGKIVIFQPVRGSQVSITDEKGTRHSLKETSPGTYVTDSTKFRGRVNGKYSLDIHTGYYNYHTDPVIMIPVPPLDSVYYEKVLLSDPDAEGPAVEACQIYLDTHDPSGACLFYRWDFRETWEFRLPYNVKNRVCWKSAGSENILIKNTSVYNQARVTRFPVHFISNETDRLDIRYSILVNQYSLGEDEYTYWEKVKNVSANVGGLYDMTPMAIDGNIHCLEEPEQPVLGYFSVSAVSSTRIYIDENFMGLPNFYSFCPTDTVFGAASVPIPGLNISRWVIMDRTGDLPPYRILTQYRQCADCTVNGSNIRPPFWED